MKTFRFVQLIRAPFELLDGMLSIHQPLNKANWSFTFTQLNVFFNKSNGMVCVAPSKARPARLPGGVNIDRHPRMKSSQLREN